MRGKFHSILTISVIAASTTLSAFVITPAAHATFAGQTYQGPPPPPPPPQSQPGAAVTDPSNPQTSRQNVGCVWTRQIFDWRRVDDTRIIVRTSPSKQFMVTFNGVCRETRYSNSLSLRRSWGGCLSRGDVLVFNRGFFHHDYDFPSMGCWVSDVSRVG